MAAANGLEVAYRDHDDVRRDLLADPGIRDRLAHDYANVDVVILTEVVEEHLPRLVGAIDRILGGR